jgi:hypothetical protein
MFLVFLPLFMLHRRVLAGGLWFFYRLPCKQKFVGYLDIILDLSRVIDLGALFYVLREGKGRYRLFTCAVMEAWMP